MTTVADYLMNRIADLGVRHVFVLPGGGSMHLVDALARSGELTAVPLLHEQAVGVAAEAYGQYGPAPGVALVTTGPGGTNALTATAAAWLDSTPCVFVSGQVKTADLVGARGVRQFGFQEIDVVAMAAPITKLAVRIDSAADAARLISRALRTCRDGRPGPVWIDIPLDVQAQEIQDHVASDDARTEPLTPADAQVDEVIARLRLSERPLVLVGNGVRLASAEEALLDLVRSLGIPVATTWKAIDLLPADDPLNAGRPGGISSYFANFTQQGADLLLCIGARLDLGQTGYRHDTFGNEALKIVVDVDEAELRKLSFAPFLPVHSDAGAFIKALARGGNSLREKDWSPWLARIAEWKARFPLSDERERAWDDGLSVYVLVEELSRAMTPDHIFVPGSSGACSEVSMQAFLNKAGQRVLNSEGLGPMGFGIPAAIGACIASSMRPTVCIDGDGGFAMNVQDLASVARLGLPITFFVLDNSGYGSIRATADSYFEGRRVGCDEASGLRIPDYAQLGPAFGVATHSVGGVEDLHALLPILMASRDPHIVVVKVSSRQVTRPRVVSRRLPDGRMETAPLEFLSPELPGLDVAQELARDLGPS